MSPVQYIWEDHVWERNNNFKKKLKQTKDNLPIVCIQRTQNNNVKLSVVREVSHYYETFVTTKALWFWSIAHCYVILLLSKSGSCVHHPFPAKHKTMASNFYWLVKWTGYKRVLTVYTLIFSHKLNIGKIYNFHTLAPCDTYRACDSDTYRACDSYHSSTTLSMVHVPWVTVTVKLVSFYKIIVALIYLCIVLNSIMSAFNVVHPIIYHVITKFRI